MSPEDSHEDRERHRRDARWQGEVDAHLRAQADRNRQYDSDLGTIKEMVAGLRIEVAKVTTKVAVIASVASIVAAAAAALVVKLTTGG